MKKNHKKKKKQTERVKERNKKRISVWDKIETPEERKTEKQRTEIYQKYVYRGDTKINEMKK